MTTADTTISSPNFHRHFRSDWSNCHRAGSSDKAETAQQAGCTHRSAHRASTGTVDLPRNLGWGKSHPGMCSETLSGRPKGADVSPYPISISWQGTHPASREGGEGSSTAQPACHKRDRGFNTGIRGCDCSDSHIEVLALPPRSRCHLAYFLKHSLTCGKYKTIRGRFIPTAQ